MSVEHDLKMQNTDLALVLVEFISDGGVLRAQLRVPLELRANAIGGIHFMNGDGGGNG